MGGLSVTAEAHAPQRTSRLPVALSAYVGRRGELDAVRSALAASRAVCLVGPGGCGKTRLAMEVAHDRDRREPDTVSWVDLAPFTDPARVPRALINALDVPDSPGRPLLDAVSTHLRDRRHLVVLDNCEHLLATCAEIVADLLRECPQLHVVVTSREVLGVDGETVWQVPPLSTPAVGVASAEELRNTESAQLFAARAQVVRPGFAIDDANALPVARICRGLDGLPLALELAAARVRMLSVDEIADALEDRLALLTAAGYAATDRHRSMRAVLDWSHRLLSEPEARLFANLSVFTDGCTLDAARAVHSGEPGEPDVFDLVAHLVDRSLVLTRSDGGRTRYLLPETVRVYAAEHLEHAGGTAAAQLRLLAWCVEFVAQADAELSGPGQATWLDRIEQERGNLGAAVRRALLAPADPQDGLRIVAGLWRFCYLRGYYTEGREWLDSILTATADAAPSAPTAVRARALVGAGTLAFLQCDYDEATNRLEDALAAYRALGDDRGVAASFSRWAAWPASAAGTRPPGRCTWRAGLWRELDDPQGVARSANYLGLLAWLQEDLRTATTFAEDAFAQFRADGDGEGIALVADQPWRQRAVRRPVRPGAGTPAGDVGPLA